MANRKNRQGQGSETFKKHQISHLNSENTPMSEDPLQDWKASEKHWLDANPEATAQLRALEAERDELRRQAKKRSKEIDAIRRRTLKDWQRYLRRGPNSNRSPATRRADHGVQNDSTPPASAAEAPPTRSAEQSVLDSTPANPTKSNAINESEDVVSKVEEGRSSSISEATDSATTLTVHAPPTEPPSAETHSDGVTAAEFHRALSVLFRAARKSIPTSSQSAACYVRLGRRAAAFLVWLPPKLPRVQHPGILPSLIDEFESCVVAEQPSAPPPRPSEQTEDQESRLMVEYEEFREKEALRLYDALSALELRRLNDGKRDLLRRQGRFDRMALDARQHEMKDLILLDIERDQVMSFTEWVEPRRKSGPSSAIAKPTTNR